MATTLDLGETIVDVVRRDIQRVQLTIHPPSGRVRVSAPDHVAIETIRLFAIAKLPWIRQQQRRLRAQEREPVREYVDRESHYVWGHRFLLKVIETGAEGVDLQARTLVLSVRRSAAPSERESALARWYRQQVRDAAEQLVRHWSKVLHVELQGIHVRRMKTKWGSCNPLRRTIRLNTELAKKPRECLEYVVAHELVHLDERRHGPRFVAALDRLLPQWRQTRDALNRLPLPEA